MLKINVSTRDAEEITARVGEVRATEYGRVVLIINDERRVKGDSHYRYRAVTLVVGDLDRDGSIQFKTIPKEYYCLKEVAKTYPILKSASLNVL